MKSHTDQELEHLFDNADIPRRHLYPIRFRLVRWIGLQIRPPVTYGYLGHLLDAAGHLVLYMIFAGSLLHYVDDTPIRLLLILTTLMVIFVSTTNWLRYRGIRRRIGLS